MSALEKMREVFESCTVMAGVESNFECVYITKDAANALFDEAKAENDKLREQLYVSEHNQTRNAREYGCMCHENNKLRELVDELWALAYGYVPDESELDAARDMMHELGIEVDA